MAGLLDNYGTDPLAQGLLQMGATLLQPRAMGGGIGPGMLAFNQGAMQAQQYRRALDQDARRSRLIDAQIGEIGAQADQRKAQMKALEAKTQAIANARASIAQARPDMLPFFDADPEGALKQIYAQPTLTEVPTEGGGTRKVWLRPGETTGPQVGDAVAPELKNIGGRMVNPRAMAPNTPVNDPNDLMHIGPDGGLVLNSELANAKRSIAKAGAASTTVKVENKMGESVGAQVGPTLKDSSIATKGAVNMADSAERVLAAIDNGGVIAGPGASLRLKGAQVASMLGIGGKDAVAQTRQVIRGLAESSIEARKELQGQGQVTENEAKAVEKAMSGNIDDLTVDEIRDIARLNLRASVRRAQQHKSYLDSLPESMRPARPFFEVQGMDRVLGLDPSRYTIKPPTGANVQPDGRTVKGTIGAPSIDDLVKKYSGNGNSR